ncbi:MAG: AraC family transcriptional regulator [Clostridia bacterium]|nr:AraC family transcriptional regulator [Clostridia bacterium]
MKLRMHAEHKCRVQTDRDLKEIGAHGTPLFPCAHYHGALTDYVAGQIPWHWHEDLEFFLVTEGRGRVLLDTEPVVLEAGQGILFNANALHSIREAGLAPCVFRSLVFHPALIGGRPEGAIYQRYVRPVLECSSLRHIRFSPEVPWQAVGLEHFQEAFQACTVGEFGYEFKLRDALSRLWRGMVENLQDELIFYVGEDRGQSARLKAMLDYIHAHFSEHIALPDIAAAASISERECCRCFERTIGMPPIMYVVHYRLCTAAVLLEDTEFSISEVCERTGFNNPSYFSKVFRRQMGYSPREYREMAQTNC